MNSMERESLAIQVWRSILTYNKELDARLMRTPCSRRVHEEFFFQGDKSD